MGGQTRHFGGEGAQRGIATAEIDKGGLPLIDAIFDQLLQPGSNTGGVIRVRPGDIGKIGGEGSVAWIDIGEDWRPAVKDGSFGEPAAKMILARPVRSTPWLISGSGSCGGARWVMSAARVVSFAARGR
jgi:hypothetical protein